MKIMFILMTFIISSCTFLEPSTLLIQNDSNHTIEISTDKEGIKNFLLEKNKGDFILITQGDINITVSINEIKFKKDYKLNLNYLEKKKFNFNLKE